MNDTISKSKDQNVSKLVEKLEAEAKKQGLSDSIELLCQDEGMRDILSRMMGSALKHANENKKVLNLTGQNIRANRLVLGLSEEDMANRISVSVERYRRIEAGTARLPLNLLQCITYELKVDSSVLLPFWFMLKWRKSGKYLLSFNTSKKFIVLDSFTN